MPPGRRRNRSHIGGGARVAKHQFCAVCGIKSFYVPRSHPEGYSVNVRCLDPGTVDKLHVEPFDGAHWEAHAAELPPLS